MYGVNHLLSVLVNQYDKIMEVMRMMMMTMIPTTVIKFHLRLNKPSDIDNSKQSQALYTHLEKLQVLTSI